MTADATTSFPVTVCATVLTHKGAVRQGNEDSFAVGALIASGVDMTTPLTVVLPVEEPVVLAVADGLGGHNAGEIASAVAAQRLAAAGDLTEPQAVADLLHGINDELYQLSADDPSCAGAGTTVVGMVVRGQELVWFNVGDSRLHRFGREGLVQVSVDDSPRPPWLEEGEPTPVTSIVLQCLGGAGKPREISPHVGIEPFVRGQRWLACSDGLTDMVPAELVAQILAGEPDDTAAVRALWSAAMAAGGEDNITIILARAA